MPISYHIDTVGQVIYLRLEGDEPTSAVIAAFREMSSRPELPPRSRMLIDLTKNQSTPTTEELREILREQMRLAKHFNGPVAMVAEPGFRFGLARMASLLVEAWGGQMQAFTSLEEAAVWLDIEDLSPEIVWTVYAH